MTWGMVAVGVGTAVAAGAGAAASSSAAGKQAAASKSAARTQQNQWSQTQDNLAPYMNLGVSSINPMIQAMGYQASQDANGRYVFTKDSSNPLQQSFTAPTAADAQATPGYQFTLDNGLKAVQNSAAARGLGTSGAALKGAAGYASGLADSTYNDVYNRALSTFNTNYTSAANNFNRLSGIVGNGQNAAATNGSLGAAAAGNIGNTLMSGANAQAAGIVGSANALSSGITNGTSNALMYGMLQNNAGGNGAAAAGGVPGWTPAGSAGAGANGMLAP